MIKVVRAKLHGITITGAELDYHGSITLDPEQCEKAGIFPMEFVEIWNKDSGARISTYVIYGEPGSRCCILNGAAARTCQKGDRVIICASDYVRPDELYAMQPVVLTFTQDNHVDEVMHYEVKETVNRKYDFFIRRDERPLGENRTLGSVNVGELGDELKSRGLDDRAVADLLSKYLSDFA
ncbi:aspartate 1-decarboxylase [Paludibacterium paludis]|uniref:Aspartate 1-decarboxylase n=1 Tax=Paludibacterium paludis TaxID=1225769 RepID=A0A918UA03_9NEIS|nr:aspartate 1-decarboxylase [Paludibacterium paludis]GGY18513.1 aspartate 1-decarboxylase [Paludibacterium paludis]